jgi:hypothetical protein
MIVFDLRCTAGHVFEAWFGSSTAYEEQRRAGHLACPICGTAEVGKALMAPAVAAKGNRAAPADAALAAAKAALRTLADAQAKALASSEWVGTGFAGRARAMHDGDAPRATIHGQATLAEAKALAADGVPIAPLPLPVVPPEQVN